LFIGAAGLILNSTDGDLSYLGGFLLGLQNVMIAPWSSSPVYTVFCAYWTFSYMEEAFDRRICNC